MVKPKRKPLSPAQAALVERMRGGRLLIYSQNGCYIEAPYSHEDGRTVGGLIDRGVLKCEGQEPWPSLSSMWVLRPEPTRG